MLPLRDGIGLRVAPALVTRVKAGQRAGSARLRPFTRVMLRSANYATSHPVRRGMPRLRTRRLVERCSRTLRRSARWAVALAHRHQAGVRRTKRLARRASRVTVFMVFPPPVLGMIVHSLVLAVRRRGAVSVTRRGGEGETRRPAACNPALVPTVFLSPCPLVTLSQTPRRAHTAPPFPPKIGGLEGQPRPVTLRGSLRQAQDRPYGHASVPASSPLHRFSGSSPRRGIARCPVATPGERVAAESRTTSHNGAGGAWAQSPRRGRRAMQEQGPRRPRPASG